LFKKLMETKQNPVDKQQDAQLNTVTETLEEMKPDEIPVHDEKPGHLAEQSDKRVLGVGEWMITILVFLLPLVNIIMMAYWAFSADGNVNRRNLSRACLLWIIILLIAYVVAMAVAGFTIMDIFVPGQ